MGGSKTPGRPRTGRTGTDKTMVRIVYTKEIIRVVPFFYPSRAIFFVRIIGTKRLVIKLDKLDRKFDKLRSARIVCVVGV